MPERMARGRLDGERIVQRVAIVDCHGLTGCNDWGDRVLPHKLIERRKGVARVCWIPAIEFLAMKQVFRVWESRQPAPVDEPGIPSDVIEVQMSAHDEIHFARRHACGL